jgi:hypothetical protein
VKTSNLTQLIYITATIVNVILGYIISDENGKKVTKIRFHI